MTNMITIETDDPDAEARMSLHNAINYAVSYGYGNPSELERSAEMLYRTKDCEKCKLAAVYELAALKLEEPIIQNWFFNNFSINEVIQFQEEDKHEKKLFDKLLEDKFKSTF